MLIHSSTGLPWSLTDCNREIANYLDVRINLVQAWSFGMAFQIHFGDKLIVSCDPIFDGFFYQKVLGMSLFLDMVSTYNLKSYGNVLKQCFTYLIVLDWREINIYPGVRHLTPINIAYL